MLGKTEGRKRNGRQRVRQLGGITDSMDMNLGRLQEMGRDRESAAHGSQRVGHNLVTEHIQSQCHQGESSAGNFYSTFHKYLIECYFSYVNVRQIFQSLKSKVSC